MPRVGPQRVKYIQGKRLDMMLEKQSLERPPNYRIIFSSAWDVRAKALIERFRKKCGLWFVDQKRDDTTLRDLSPVIVAFSRCLNVLVILMRLVQQSSLSVDRVATLNRT